MAAEVAYEALYGPDVTPAPLDVHSVSEFLRCSMGLSARKQYRTSRWALRVNPSSGNLHPTEAYIVWGLRVCHYAPQPHLVEQRCVLPEKAWHEFAGDAPGFLVALTSIHWREAWKYGERAFRYCQHDAGHAIAALRFAAAMLGWKLTLLPRWADEAIATLLGLDRQMDFDAAETEEPECIAIVSPHETSRWIDADPVSLVRAARAAEWCGTANRLSPDHVEWPIIERVAQATRYPGSGIRDRGSLMPASFASGSLIPDPGSRVTAREVILRRRSAVAFDGRSTLPSHVFMSMLRRLLPGSPPWDAIDWPSQVHLILFVHRVEGMTPGVYAFLRDPTVAAEWRAAMRPDFLWEPVNLTNDPNVPNDSNVPNDPNDSNDSNDSNGLYLLVPVDVRLAASRLSCDQDIAADGFFSLGMLTRVESSLRQYGEWFYRRLFWECGLIGQVLYLEAEAAGARGTGIGCFYDDPVHDTLGLSGHAWQSLYHFSMGMPIEDTRLTTEPGYPWEG